MRWCVAAAVIWMSIVGVAVPDEMHASIRRPTNIPAQELGPALQILAKDRSLQIIYVSEEISERRTHGAVGELNTEEALQQLLEGTGLTFKYLDDMTVTVVPTTSAASPSSTAARVASTGTAGGRPQSSTAKRVQSEAASEPAKLPQVTIEAERQALTERITHFVRTMTTQVSSYESLARWGVKVCPAVSGLPAPQGEFILQRISTIARSADIPLGASDCKPNLWVMVTAEPSRLVKDLWSRNSSRLLDLSGRPATATEMRRFIDNPVPIRAWYGAELVGAMGNELGTYGDVGHDHRAPKVNTLPTMSRIQHDDLQTIRSTLVVVDKGRITGLSIGAVADYVALVGLAEVDLAGDYSSAESILSLFSAPEKGQSITQLSAWDAAFLKALYATDQSSKFHYTAIVEKMLSYPEILPVTPGATLP
jgi:hypothetical protein